MPSSPPLSARQCDFVEAQRVGRLATADAAGVPHVVPVCFAVLGDALYVTIDAKPKRTPGGSLKRLRNIAANPSVAFVADRYDEDWSRLGWVMLRGRAEILEAGRSMTAPRRRCARVIRNTARWTSPPCR